MESKEEGTQSNNKVSLTIKRRKWGRQLQPCSEPPAKYLKTNSCATVAPANSSATGNEVHHNTGEDVLSTFDRMMTKSFDNPYDNFFETSSSEDELANTFASPVKIQHEEVTSRSQPVNISQDKVRMKIRSPQGWNQRTMLTSKRKVLGSPIDREKLVKQFGSSKGNECVDTDDGEIEPISEKNECDKEKTFYAVMFAKPSMKKHKTWDEDGFMVTDGINFVLKDTNGEVIESSSKIKLTEEMLSECKPFRLGGKEVQIQEQLSQNPFCGATAGSSTLSTLDTVSVPIQGHENQEKFMGRTTGFDEYNTPHVEVFEHSCLSEDRPIKIESSDDDDGVEEIHFERYYSAMFSKPSTKKHKTWDEDGFIVTDGINFVLKDTNGEVIESSSKIKLTEEMLSECKPFRLGGKEVQIQEQLSQNPFCGAGSSTLSTLDTVSVCIQEHENQEEFIGTTTRSDEYNTPHEEVFENSCAFEDRPIKIESSDDDDAEAIHLERFYSAMFSKQSTKKHKTWDEDGFIVTDGINVVLKNINGGIVGSSKFQLTEEMLSECKPFKLGSKEVQIQEQISNNPFPEKLSESHSY